MKGLHFCYILKYKIMVRQYINVRPFSTILTPHTSIKSARGDKAVPLEYLLMFKACSGGLTDLVTSAVHNEEVLF